MYHTGRLYLSVNIFISFISDILMSLHTFFCFIIFFVSLFSDVVRLERPDLEKQRNELIVNINTAKNELKVRL